MTFESVEPRLFSDVSQFLYREARLQDEHQYAAWESLWTEDGLYWVPANGDDNDPETSMSIIYDNRSRIALRVKQLLTGRRHSQEPRSRLRRTIANIEIADRQGGEVGAAANVVIYESNLRGVTIWAARCEYVLRRADGGFRMARKKVSLVNNDKALYTLSFLI